MGCITLFECLKIIYFAMNPPSNDVDRIDTDYIYYWIREDHILEAKYKDDLMHITLEIAEKIVSDRLAIQQDQHFRILVNFPKSQLKLNPAARRYLDSGAGMAGIAAIAILNARERWAMGLICWFALRFQWKKPPIECFFDRDNAIRWLKAVALHEEEPTAPPRTTFKLTQVKKQIALHMSKGLTNKQIAAEMHLSSRTIESHRQEMYKMFNVTNGLQLLQRLHDMALLEGE